MTSLVPKMRREKFDSDAEYRDAMGNFAYDHRPLVFCPQCTVYLVEDGHKFCYCCERLNQMRAA